MSLQAKANLGCRAPRAGRAARPDMYPFTSRRVIGMRVSFSSNLDPAPLTSSAGDRGEFESSFPSYRISGVS
jgi:hypothetical protein